MSPLPSRIAARVLGYGIIAGVLFFLAFFGTFVVRELRDPGPVVHVRFPEIATLSEGDEVVESGVLVGRVARIALDGQGAVVELHLDRRPLPARDTRFVNFSHSLMGERKVWIRPGTSPLPLDPSEVQEGIFVPGLAETLHKVSALTERVAVWREAVGDATLGDSGIPLRLLLRMERAVAGLSALDSSLHQAADVLKVGVRGLSSLEAGFVAGLHGADSGLALAESHVGATHTKLATLEEELVSALTGIERMAALLNADSGAGRLLVDRALYDSLVGGVERLAGVVRRFRDEGLGDSMKVRPRRAGAKQVGKPNTKP